MRKRITAVCLIIIILLSFSCCVTAENEAAGKLNTEEKTHGLSAKSPYALLFDLKTGAVLYEKSASERVYPASLTNIMTAVLVLENSNLEELATASETALSNVSPGDNKMGIIKEERLSVRQLLYGMMLASASDAANVLAENTSGSIEEFVALMNKKAKELGMKNTNFNNPTGEFDERHYTTASDMQKLVLHAMSIPEFCEIVKCQSYSIPPTEQNKSARKVTNKNHFVSNLLRNDYYYKYSTGIKSGYSPEAKSCIAASAEKGSIHLGALIFGADTEDNVALSFTDCRDMFDYVFNNYSSRTIVSQGEILAQTEIINTRRDNKLILKAENKVSVIKLKDAANPEITYKDYFPKSVSAPVEKDQLIGTREYFLNGKSIGKLNLLAEKSYALDPITFVINKMVAFVTSPWLFAAIALAIAIFIFLERRRRRILRKKRRDAQKKRNRELLRKIDE